MMIDGDKVLVKLEELRESSKPDPWDTPIQNNLKVLRMNVIAMCIDAVKEEMHD